MKNLDSPPLISVVVPLYNARHFIVSGIASIRSQTFQDWELVAVNDGSTDDTEARLFELTAGMPQKLVYKCQENGGGFAARNTGLDLASGKYIALFDIDDHWFPHHLEDLHRALETHKEIDWIFAANQIKDLTTTTIVAESSLYDKGKPKPVLSLRKKVIDGLSIITDEQAISCQIEHGLWCGQQFSLIRREVFADYRFRANYRNEAADQVSVIAALKRGFVFAYTENIHGIYHIHTGNASAGCKDAPVEKYLRLRNALIRGFDEVKSEEQLQGSDASAIDRRVAKEYFWCIGYQLFWLKGKPLDALRYFRMGLRRYPWDISMWKTFLLSSLRTLLRKTHPHPS